MTTDVIVTTVFRVGHRKCTMTMLDCDAIVTEWSPGIPTSLSEEEADAYEAGCKEFFATAAEILGEGVLTVEAEPWLSVTPGR